MRFVIPFILYSCFPLVTQAVDLRFTASCRYAYEEIYTLRFDALRSSLYKLEASEPQNAVPVYLKAHSAFVRHLLTGNQVDRIEFGVESARTWKMLEATSNRSSWYYYISASLLLQEAIFQFDDNQTAAAGLKLKRAFQYYQKALDIDPNFLPAKLERSVLEILFSSVPDDFAWVIRALGIRPDSKSAFKNLRAVTDSLISSSQYRLITVPSFAMQGYLLRNYADEKQVLETLLIKMDEHLQRHPKYNSALLLYTKAKAYSTLKWNGKVVEVLEGYVASEGQTPMPYLYLMRAEIKLYSLEESISKDCHLFLNSFRGKDFVKRIYQMLAWEALLTGDSAGALKQYKALLTHGRVKYEDDILAQKEASQGHFPNIHLLRVRLLYDGAHYDRALSALLAGSPSIVCRNLEEQMEYFYRLARIYHAMDNLDKALQFYLMVIDMGRESTRYFAGNAALQMGLIYEHRKNHDKAREYFNLCLSMPFVEYRKGIQQKAKAGLARLDKR